VIKDRPNYTPQQIRELSEKWFARQIEIISKAHGDSWPEHREWIEDYLKEELRERLEAIGWRKKQ
jgi:hypothetical protein